MSEDIFAVLCAACDHLSVGLLILSASGQMLFANREANLMVEAGWPVRLANGCLQGRDCRVSDALKEAIAVLSACPQNADAPHRDVCLAQPSEDRPGAIAQLRPLHSQGSEPAIALFILQSGQDNHYGLDSLAVVYGLSKAETRILKAIAETQGQGEAAASLNIAPSTVKSHLRKIFQKTNTCRQADLLRLVECYRTPFRKSSPH